MGLLDILQQYVGQASSSDAASAAHFNEVAQQVPPQQLGQGVAAAFRSDATPPFAQMVGDLFNHSNPEQRAGLLGQLTQALGPGALAGVAGGALGKLFAGNAAPTSVSPQQAATVSPADVTALAAHAEQQDSSIVDKLGAFYAQHPTLVQSLGAVALSAVMGHLGNQQQQQQQR